MEQRNRTISSSKPESDSKSWSLRPATLSDVPALEKLIPLSARTLQASYYSAAQIDRALGPVFGVDRQLIRDGTYFVAEEDGRITGCGGWSRRGSFYGGDGDGKDEDELLTPGVDAARIRAFFVHPDRARRGIGRSIIQSCESAIVRAGFTRVEIVATLAGEPLYAAFGYSVTLRDEIDLGNGLTLPVVRMTKTLTGPDFG